MGPALRPRASSPLATASRAKDLQHFRSVAEPSSRLLDRRSQEAAAKRGIDISHQRSRQINQDDVLKFDYLVAMDRSNIDNLEHLVPAEMTPKLSRFLEFAPGLSHSDVPDPYYGGASGFDNVLDLIEEASYGLLDHIRKHNL